MIALGWMAAGEKAAEGCDHPRFLTDGENFGDSPRETCAKRGRSPDMSLRIRKNHILLRRFGILSGIAVSGCPQARGSVDLAVQRLAAVAACWRSHISYSLKSHFFHGDSHMRHVLSALVMNQPGVLAHVSGMLASRAFNIVSLAVGATENAEYSRITFVVNGDDKVLDQVRKQLEKMITVVKVQDYGQRDFVERDLMLIKVNASGGRRAEVRELTDIFRGRIVDVGPGHAMIELSGRESKIEAFVERMREFGILEMVRTGRVAMLRDETITQDLPSDVIPECSEATAS